MSSTTVTTSLSQYKPSLDLAALSIWEAMKLVDLLAAVSTILNATIPAEGNPSVIKYLDDWQALFTAATFDIAKTVEAMRPTDSKEQTARNWLLAKIELACADGLVTIVGPGAPNIYDDAFTAGLIAAQYVQPEGK